MRAKRPIVARRQGSKDQGRQTIELIIVTVFGQILVQWILKLGTSLVLALLVWAVVAGLSAWFLLPESTTTRRRHRRGALKRLSRICPVVLGGSLLIIVGVALRHPQGSIDGTVLGTDQAALSDVEVNALGGGTNNVGRAALTDDRGYFKVDGLRGGDNFIILFQVVGETILTAEFVISATETRYGPPECAFPSDESAMRYLDPIHFDRDSFRLDDRDLMQIHKVAYLLKHDPEYFGCRLLVHGHCSTPGSRRHNLALGESRARAVRDELISLGVPREQMLMVSYGKSKLAAVGENDRAHRLNQRVEFIVLPHSDKYDSFLASSGSRRDMRVHVSEETESRVFAAATPLASSHYRLAFPYRQGCSRQKASVCFTCRCTCPAINDIPYPLTL